MTVTYLSPADDVPKFGMATGATTTAEVGMVKVAVYDFGLYRLAVLATREGISQLESNPTAIVGRAYFDIPVETARELGAVA